VARVGHFDRPVICSLSLYLRRRWHGSGISIIQFYFPCPFILGGCGTGGAFRSSSYMFFVPLSKATDGGTGRGILIVQLYVLCPLFQGDGGTGRAFRSSRAGIFKKSMGTRNRGGIGLSYRPARLHRLAEFIH
jgi:hypothetical protein